MKCYTSCRSAALDNQNLINSHLSGLLLERIQNSINELLLQPGVDIGRAHAAHDLLDGLHDHLPVLLVLVLQVVHEAVDDLGGAHAVGDLNGGVNQLSGKRRKETKG